MLELLFGGWELISGFFSMFGADGLFDNWFNSGMKIIIAVVPALTGAAIVYFRNRKSERWFSFKDVVMIGLLIIVGFIVFKVA